LAWRTPIVTQAPLIVIPGATVAFLLRWGLARLWSSQQIETLRERLTLAQEKASAAQDKAVALTEQIQSNVGQAELLISANSTVLLSALRIDNFLGIID